MAFFIPTKRVAGIEFSGVIGRKIRPETHLPLLERARKSSAIRAVVLLIDSPGGSAAASEELYLEVERIAARKPVVAYVRGLSASGALYISAACHKIVAVRNALVGSIGVIFTHLVAERLLQKAGISFSIQKTGPHKDMFGPWRVPTPAETQKLDVMMAGVYQRFIDVVAKGRHMDEAAVRDLATGELFSAQQAKDKGLVDELGDLDTALNLAGNMAGIKPSITYLRPRRPMFPLLRGNFAQDVVDSLMGEVEGAMLGRLRL